MTAPTPPADGIEVRDVRTHDEFVACVDLQAAIWGAGFREAVPATILKISQRLGGVTAGAFAADGALLGFVFGMTGLERGEIVHWSDILAVRADRQNLGLGRRLKEFQREAVRALGATRMYWTYDPLVARNAHFNLNRLGARVTEYVPDMYGTDTGSAMHSGFGTDRFVVVWPLGEAGAHASRASRASRASEAGAAAAAAEAAPILNEGVAEGREADVARLAAAPPPRVRVEIPADVFRVQAASVADAVRWRTTSRRALQWALAHGYVVERLALDASGARAFYVLARA